MKKLIKSAFVVNEGTTKVQDVLIDNHGIIQSIGSSLQTGSGLVEEIIAEGLYLLPGVIDDQVHFREPGLTHKASIYSESRAAVAGGITTFMEMPNTVPSATTIELLEQKYQIAARTAVANYSFFMGTTNTNADEVLRADPRKICGIKIFMGSSTGDMLVDDEKTLEKIFAEASMLIAIHSEDDKVVKRNMAYYKEKFGEENLVASMHPEIRNVEACMQCTTRAVDLAKKHGTKLHVLHISTKDELTFFTNDIPLSEKKITAEACVHHLWFSKDDYTRLGNLIKCNPAIKEKDHREAIFEAVLDDRIDIIATDHAPHTWDEKQLPFSKAPSGLPLVQHSLPMMLTQVSKGKLSLEKMVDKMSHKPAELFQIKNRGFIRVGYYADLVLVDPFLKNTVTKDSLYYACKWSPLEGEELMGKVLKTWVNGHLVYNQGEVYDHHKGMRLEFRR